MDLRKSLKREKKKSSGPTCIFFARLTNGYEMARTAQLGTPNVKSFTNCDATVSSDVQRRRVSAKGSRVFGFKCFVLFFVVVIVG